MEIIDKRNSLPTHPSKRYKRRSLSAIKNIAIHHSATTSGSAESFARYHVNTLGWPGIAYHYVVDKDGTISHCHDLEVVSYHVGNSNYRAVGICMVGDFRTQQLSVAQKKATQNLVLSLLDVLTINVEDVWGHQEFPGYEWKPCPSINMGNFRSELMGITKGSKQPIYRSTSYSSGPRTRTYLSYGDQGDDIKALQERLEKLGFKPGIIDGIFGKVTEDAVKRFQKANNLRVDGIVGPETREALKKYDAEVPIIELASPTDEESDDSELYESESRRTLRLLTPYIRGEDVRDVQEKIGAVADGIFGPSTAEAVRRFQSQRGLVADGIVGPKTWQALDRVKTGGVPYSRLLFLASPYLQGRDVKRVQQALNISADGIFGPMTDQAVRNFQRRERLEVDGIVGPNTWNRLMD
ncbi:N-acetylmuramoyl-L-alanine amidase [Bacillus pinisoli]|uniref:peptidoglycan recognition protein family protein n=1 Tax=Bacillus pinisoli TaxID=2901866 RepID=UPI001FF1F97C|nr:N-acetylmuramoyl-L-alanine amidase [Bacillus pinisoli]